MNPPDPHAEWGKFHGVLFGLVTDSDAKMLAEWAALFAAEGYAPDELQAASRWLALNDPPRFRTDHLLRLQDRLRQLRRQACAPPPVEDTRGTCTTCRGVGRVIVPLLLGIPTAGGSLVPDDGQRRTAAVTCSCGLGRWFSQQGCEPAMMTLDQYQAIVPDWRTREVSQRSVAHERRRVAEKTRSLDQTMGAVAVKAVSAR